MANQKEIRKRIGTVKSTQKITRAMKMVAGARLNRAQHRIQALRPYAVQTGEVVKVDLYASLPAERYFVVLDDPVPGGLEPVNTDLATASQTDTVGEPVPAANGSYHHRFTDWREDTFSRWSFYHRELRHDAVRFYSERLAAGRYHLSYTAQAIASGEFRILPAHAEEMYAPEVYGNSAPAGLRVEPAK